jgi:hypothetical protein
MIMNFLFFNPVNLVNPVNFLTPFLMRRESLEIKDLKPIGAAPYRLQM